MLERLPSDLWSQGPTDVGFCDVIPVTFKMSSSEPVWVPQYRNKPEAEEGVSATVAGLLEKGVMILIGTLPFSQSQNLGPISTGSCMTCGESMRWCKHPL